jgi:PKD repeat protein
MNWTSGAAKPKEQANHTEHKVKVQTPPAKVEEIKDFLSDKNAATKSSEQPVNPPVAENKENGVVIKKDKKELESVINSLSGKTIATISASNVGGSVPLIVSVSNNGSGKINRWDFGDGKKETGSDPIHVYDVPGIYTITLTSTAADGSVATDNIKVEVTASSMLKNPGIDEVSFTPNGDSINDIFIQRGENMQEMRVVIFDSKQNIVKSIFLKRNQNEKLKTDGRGSELVGQWDGLDMQGKPAKEGTYYYILNAIGGDGKKYDKKGKINLSR